MASDTPHPLRAGLEAARATWLPGLLVQMMMIGVVLIYYRLPSTRPFFDRIAFWRTQGGVSFAVASTMAAGGLFPEILRIVFFQRGRVNRKNWQNLAFALPFWGLQGVWVDWLYRGQALWFGNDAAVSTIIKKVCVDQFLYNPLVAAPFGITLYEWKNRGYRWSSQFMTWDWYRSRIFPGLVATWAVWIPLVTIIYCLPQTLQIPIFCMALTFWVTLFTWMTESLTEKPSVADATHFA